MRFQMELLVLIATLFASNEATFNNNYLPVERQRQAVGRSNNIPREMKSTISQFLADTPPTRHTNCEMIPDEFGLCYGMEYSRMRLPNLLGHETMTEIMQQSRPWPPLVSNGCHPETRKFLCSLYAPVCMKGYDKSIQPCRSLCESVRDACSPAMATFGFSWPEILNCSKFPVAGDVGNLCIPESEMNSSPEPKTCRPCRQKKVSLSIRKKLCSFDFVMKVRVRHLEFDHGATRILINRRSRDVFKWPSGIPRSKRNSLWMLDGLHCTCNVIKNTRTRYFVTGWKEGKNLMLHSITRWSKKYRRVVKKLKRSRCSSKS